MKNTALRFGLVAVISIMAAASGYYWHVSHSSAATCSASVSWNTSSVAQGGDATETWTVTGDAAKASASCTDYDNINSIIIDNLSFGPQSYTFRNIQKSITCSVWGTAKDGSACVPSGPQTVTVTTSGGGTTNPPPAGGGNERCWFDKPGKTGMGFADQDPNYTVELNADICGTIQQGDDRTGFCSGELGWKAVNGSAWNAPLLDKSSYTFHLSGGSLNQNVDPSGSLIINRSELLQNKTYTLSVLKAGSSNPVTSCSVSVNASTPGADPTGNLAQLQVPPGIFPDPGTYSAPSTSGLLNVNYSYAPQLPGVFVPVMADSLLGPSWASGNSLGTFLGQFRKAIYYVIGHEPGAFGSWDLSDPLHPASPNLHFLSSVNGNGPIQNTWPHASHGIGAAVAENEGGDARMLDRDGLAPWYGNSYVCGNDPVTGYPLICHRSFSNGAMGTTAHSFTPGQAAFGQQLDLVESGTPMAVFATNEGNFFAYSNTAKKINIYDLTDLAGDANPPYLKPAGSIGWTGVEDMTLTQIPNRSTQMLIAKLKSTWKIGELSTGSGKVIKSKTVSLRSDGNSSLQYAAANGSSYILAAEKTTSDYKSSSVFTPNVGDITIGIYKLNTSTLDVTRKGSITVKSAGLSPVGGIAYFTVIPSDADSGYPLIAVPQFKKTSYVVNKITYLTATEDGVGLYSLKDAIAKGGDISLDPALRIPAVTQWPVPVGGIIVNNWPLNGFMDANGKLYVYRNAFYYNGKSDTTNGISKIWAKNGDIGPANSPGMSYWGNPSLRVDSADVSGLFGAATTTPPVTPPVATTTPPTTTPPPASGGDSCPPGLENYCDMIKQLQRSICALAPASAGCPVK